MRLPQTQRLHATLLFVLVRCVPSKVPQKDSVILFRLLFGTIIHGLESFRKFHCMLKELFKVVFQHMI